MMRGKEAQASLIETAVVAVKAIGFAIDDLDLAWRESDYGPMYLLDKVQFVGGNLLRPGWLKEQVCHYSSSQYGGHLLDCVFPVSDNPQIFSSTPFEVCLSDTPVQVLGWQEVKELKVEGINLGLDGGYIEKGFEDRAEKRGIDLEFSFWEFASGQQQTEAESAGFSLI